MTVYKSFLFKESAKLFLLFDCKWINNEKISEFLKNNLNKTNYHGYYYNIMKIFREFGLIKIKRLNKKNYLVKLTQKGKMLKNTLLRLLEYEIYFDKERFEEILNFIKKNHCKECQRLAESVIV